MSTPKKRVGILISGRGSNMMALIAAARAPAYPAEIACVLSNRPEAEGLKKAQAAGVPAIAVDHTTFESREAFEAALDAELEAFRVDLVACAGFMRLLTPAFVARRRNRMLNIHPSLLPAFRGLNTHERALQAGVKITGCTVHVVRPDMDDGPIIAQAAVPVREADSVESLAARVLEAEHMLYPHALALLAAGQVLIADKKVVGPQVPVNQEKALFWPPLAGGNP
jgi:phosphoribosylglycinamide formyltransferase-1